MSNDEARKLDGCSDVSELLSDYHDGRFASDSWQTEQIEQHLSSCTRCAEALDDYRAISSAAKVLRETEVPELDIERMQAAINGSLSRIVAVRRIAWAGAGLSAVAAAAALLVAAFMPPRSPAAPEGVAKDPAKDKPVVATDGTEEAPTVATKVEESKEDAAAREKAIDEILAELKAKPDDIGNTQVRARIKQRLKAVGFKVSDSDGIRIIRMHDGARLSPQSFIEELERMRPDSGMIKVDGAPTK